MPACSIVKTITPRCHGRSDALLHEAKGLGTRYFGLGTVDDLMHYCTRPSASCTSASDRPRHLGVIVLTILQAGMKYLFYYQTHLIKY